MNTPSIKDVGKITLCGLLMPIIAYASSKPYYLLLPLCQKAELPLAALSVCQWLAALVVTLCVIAITRLSRKTSAWVLAALVLGAICSLSIAIAFDWLRELGGGLTGIRILFLAYLICIPLWATGRKKANSEDGVSKTVDNQ